MRFKLLVKAICCLGLVLYSSSFAKELNPLQYDARLCSAQLLVIQGDVTRLQNTRTKSHHKTGLKQRIAGALNSISWLCKQKSILLGFSNIDGVLHQKKISDIRSSFETGNWRKSESALKYLITAMPLDLEPFNLNKAPKETLQTSISIYKHYCKACHHQPYDQVNTPAYSLFDMAKTMPRNEFLARMLVGVHGTPKIALRNPLTDDDISGMTHYFKKYN